MTRGALVVAPTIRPRTRGARPPMSARHVGVLVACALFLFAVLVSATFGVAVPRPLFVLAVPAAVAACLFLMAGHGARADDEIEDEPLPWTRAREAVDAIPTHLVRVTAWRAAPGGIVVHGRPGGAVGVVQGRLADAVTIALGYRPLVVVSEAGPGEIEIAISEVPASEALAADSPPSRPLLAAGLALATLVTTTLAGAAHVGVDVISEPAQWTRGLPFGVGVMLVLGVHEMGHYLMARRRGLAASLPYFVRVPFGLGALHLGHTLVLHPLSFAGWIGLLLTGLNLVPIGQLDRGHVSRAWLGSVRAGLLGRAALFGLVALGVFVWPGFLLWAVVAYLVADRPTSPPEDDFTPLDSTRRAIAIGAFTFAALILAPVPQVLARALGLHCPYL